MRRIQNCMLPFLPLLIQIPTTRFGANATYSANFSNIRVSLTVGAFSDVALAGISIYFVHMIHVYELFLVFCGYDISLV
jgi:hypothetical protein